VQCGTNKLQSYLADPRVRGSLQTKDKESPMKNDGAKQLQSYVTASRKQGQRLNDVALRLHRAETQKRKEVAAAPKRKRP